MTTGHQCWACFNDINITSSSHIDSDGEEFSMYHKLVTRDDIPQLEHFHKFIRICFPCRLRMKIILDFRDQCLKVAQHIIDSSDSKTIEQAKVQPKEETICLDEEETEGDYARDDEQIKNAFSSDATSFDETTLTSNYMTTPGHADESNETSDTTSVCDEEPKTVFASSNNTVKSKRNERTAPMSVKSVANSASSNVTMISDSSDYCDVSVSNHNCNASTTEAEEDTVRHTEVTLPSVQSEETVATIVYAPATNVSTADAETVSDECTCASTQHKCSKRSKCFTSCLHFNSHMRQHNCDVNARFVCVLCQKVFKQNSKLTRHMRTHSGERPYRCALCTRAYTRKYNLREHEVLVHETARVHSEDKPFRCAHCPFRSKYAAALGRHKVRCHMNDTLKPSKPGVKLSDRTETQSFSCLTCPKQFRSSAALQWHTLKRCRQLFHCEHCPFESEYKQSLRKHTKRHHKNGGDKRSQRRKTQRVSCSYCSKQFESKADLQRHELMHRNEKPKDLQQQECVPRLKSPETVEEEHQQ